MATTHLDGLKLHRPAAAYTSHPLWDQLSSEHCSFDEACSLLAGGAAEDLLASPTGGRQLRLKRPGGELLRSGRASSHVKSRYAVRVVAPAALATRRTLQGSSACAAPAAARCRASQLRL